MPKLTTAKIDSLSKPGMYGDGNTLYVNVGRGGSKSWIQRVVVRGRRRDIGLGSCARVPLARARALAAANLVTIAAGGDPLERRKRAPAPTFREAARTTLDGLQPRWREGSWAPTTWGRSMEHHVLPAIGDMPVNEISREQVLEILTTIQDTRQYTARKVRQRIRATLAWALAHGHVDVNVAGEAMDGAPPWHDVPAILATVAESGTGMPALRRISRDFLAPSGPTLGALPSAAIFSLQVVQRWGHFQVHTHSPCDWTNRLGLSSTRRSIR